MLNFKFVKRLSVFAAMCAIAAMAVVYSLISGITSGANDLDVKKTSQALTATLSGLLEHSKALNQDNAKRDDAAENIYTLNPEWIESTWGEAAGDKNYDVGYIVDQTGETLVSFQAGEGPPAPAKEYFGADLPLYLEYATPKDGVFSNFASFQNINGTLSIVSISPVMYFTEGKTIPKNQLRYLIFSKPMTKDVVAEVGASLAIYGLRLSSNHSNQVPSMSFMTGLGQPAIYATWQAENPGDVAWQSIKAMTVFTLLSLFACVMTFIMITTLLAKKLETNAKNAWNHAHTDALTGLPNRQSINELLLEKINLTAGGENTKLIVMLLDLDGFKQVNDSYGHDIGDGAIRAFSAGINSICNHYGASFGRLGGDEFAVIICSETAEQTMHDLNSAAFRFISEPLNIQGRIAILGVSIGVSISPSEKITGSEMLRQADVAMYTAKERGKNRFVIYAVELEEKRRERVAMASQLAIAIDAKHIEVAYQPVVESRSREIIGVEALARWKDSTGKAIPPDEFIPIAEEYGLIDKLGSLVLRQACVDALPWGQLKLSVNISPVQFKNPDFVKDLIKIVDECGFPPVRLEIEITEGYLIENNQSAAPLLESLRQHGFSLALDDFGIGYSSIGYLRNYKFDRLKIDKSLIRGMTTNETSRSIIQATAALAQCMDMRITAEGVEHEEEANILWLAGCDTLQGYHFGRPQTAEMFTTKIIGTSLAAIQA